MILVVLLSLVLTSCPWKTTFTLTIQKEGNGSVDPAVGSHEYPKNTTVTVRAVSDTDWKFAGWEGEVASADSTVTTVLMNKNKTVKAKFVIADPVQQIIDQIDQSVPLSFRHAEKLLPLVDGNTEKFLSLLAGEDPLERWAAAYAFQRTSLAGTVLEELMDYLEDPDATIRALIAVAFLYNGEQDGKEVLEDLLPSDEQMMFSIPPVKLSDFARSLLSVYYPLEYPPAFYTPQTTSLEGGPCDYTITVTAVFHGTGATDTLIANWETETEEIWNGEDGYRVWGGGCCTVKFDFDFSLLAPGEQPPEDAHVIEVKAVAGSHTSWVGTPLPTPGSTETTTGEWDNLDSGPVVAHEIGHLMGLDDEYHYHNGNYVNDNPQPEGSPPSLMAQTWDDAQPLGEHLDAIMAAADIDCDCEYTLTIDPPDDLNISPGSHTVNITALRADSTPAKNTKLQLTITGLHPRGPVELTTDDEGKVDYTYQCIQFKHAGTDQIDITADCSASAHATKVWFDLEEIFPIPKWPFDWQRDYPYDLPFRVDFDVDPQKVLGAKNLEFIVKLYKDDALVYESRGASNVFQTDIMLEPGLDYSLIITPATTPTDIKGNETEIHFTTAVPAPDYEVPPENLEVDMSASDTGIRSSEFARLIEESIVEAGYKYMTLIFSQCYGGGMFKDLDHLENTLLKSASRWNEVAYDCFLIDNPSESYLCWLEELRKALENDRSIAHADDEALRNDPIGPFADPPDVFGRVEHPQGLYSGDQYVKLTDDASSKHALIFSGDDEPDFVDASRWETTLTSTPFNFEVTTISGGTREDLENALQTIAEEMNENEVFLFIFTGHGSVGQEITSKVTVPEEGVTLDFQASDELLEILVAAERELLYFTLDSTISESSSYTLLLNEFLLGSTDPALKRNTFELPVGSINWGGMNHLSIQPTLPITESHTLYDLFLDTGPIPYGQCGCH